jgi:hypothetical protein
MYCMNSRDRCLLRLLSFVTLTPSPTAVLPVCYAFQTLLIPEAEAGIHLNAEFVDKHLRVRSKARP